MTDLVIRFAGGSQALIGAVSLIAVLAQLGDTDGRPDSDFAGWAQYGLGAGLVAVMAVTGMRIALGEELDAWRAVALLVSSLVAGLAGLLLMGWATAN